MRKTQDNKKKNSKSLKKTHSKRKTHSKKKPRSKRKTSKMFKRMRKNGGGTGFSIPKNPDDSSNCQYSPNTLHEFIISSAQLGHQMELKHLIKTCNEDIVAIINKPYSYGDTALILASDRDHNKIAKILIEAGANVNAQNDTGYTALLTATRRDNPELVKILIEAGANVNTQDNGGETALIMAAYKCSGKMVKILLKAGSDIKIQDQKGNTAMMTATSRGCDNVAKMLRKSFEVVQNEIKRDIDNFPEKGRTAAAKVLYPGHLSRLVNSYLDGEKKTGGKKTRSKLYGGKKVPLYPNEKLYHGVGTKNYEMVQEAFNNGADYNSTGDKGSELIMVAIKNGDTKMISLLQKNGIDIKKFIKNGDTKMISLLQENGIDIKKFIHDINNKIMEHKYF
jgi:uncharacterized protein